MSMEAILNEEYLGMTVFQMVEKMTESFRDREVFAYWRDGRAVSISYAAFFRDVKRLAAYFDQLNLRGRRIVIDGRNTYEQFTAFYAAMSMGAVAAPLCFDLETEDLRDLVRRLEPGLILYDEEDGEIVPDIRQNFPVMACMGEKGVRGVLDGDGPLYEDDGRTDPGQPALILATSGSSDKPKLVVHTHRSIMPHEKRYARRGLYVCPMYHVAVVWLMMDIASGVSNCLSNFGRAAFDLQWYHPETIFAVPGFVGLLMKRDAKGTLDLGGFHRITSGGAAQNPEAAAYLNGRGIFYGSMYGTTEAGCSVTYSVPGRCRAGSDGAVGPWNEVRISERGEVLVRGGNVMLGYLDDPEATAETLVDGWYHTGDLGHLDEDGFLSITGRIKNIIVLSNGENVSPEAVENKLSVFDEINEALVLAEGDQIAAHVWCGEGRDPDREDRVRAFIAGYNRKVPSYQAIRNVVFREEPFPKTASGKLKRSL